MNSTIARQTTGIKIEVSHSALRPLVRSSIGLVCATAWLVLLLATTFTPWTISVGLLAGLYVLGTSEEAPRVEHGGDEH